MVLSILNAFRLKAIGEDVRDFLFVLSYVMKGRWPLYTVLERNIKFKTFSSIF